MILTFTPNPCVDKTVFIDRLEPGAKIRSSKYTCIPGGKGTNVSRAVKALGHESEAMVIVGGPTGRHVVDMIERQDGLPCIPLWVEGMTRTITTVLEEPAHRQTAFFEPGPRVSKAEIEQIVATFEEAAPRARVVTFNGTVPDPALRSLYARLIRIAWDAEVVPILDTYGAELASGLSAHPYMVKPNQTEAEGLLGFPLDTPGARRRAIDFFHERGVTLVVLSLGKDGALISRDGERLLATPPAIEEVNAVGSGDALVAAFAIGIEEDWPLEEMARMGVAAGAANAMSWDIGHLSRALVERIAAEVRIVRA
ncbi:MAG TPA: 1-phosphofructokinase family hexose kinase [Candidatus Hydrogenedentes bacterium]|nr:1-phosphofructokinase family hexose kinase [Candidatus Hydrogenedentota bacterium]HNT88226.1 1-phosphofructokinase family hexose kinase [Candidatus Hydrogenedentota bacterium]